MRIIVSKETAASGNPTGKYKAHPEGKPEIYGLGDSLREAVADLILAHQSNLGITVEYQ